MKCLKHFENVQHFFLQSNDFLEYTLNLTENVIVQLNTYSSEKHKKT